MKVDVRTLLEADLPEAERIVRWAFGTKLGIPDPDNWRKEMSLKGRMLVEPDGVFGAYSDDGLVGAVFAIAWGSFGFFGPLVVHPKHWGNGVARQLLEPVMEFFQKRVKHEALYTFSDSPLHIGLYQKFGYWPRFLTAIMTKDIVGPPQVRSPILSRRFQMRKFSELDKEQKAECYQQVRQVCSTIYDGLDPSKEIEAVDRLPIGETVLISNQGGLVGFAVCHYGTGSEADAGQYYIKFGCARSGADASSIFAELLEACTDCARKAGANALMAGVNTARHWAFQTMTGNGFRSSGFGVAMHKPNEPAYDRPDAFVIDDWR